MAGLSSRPGHTATAPREGPTRALIRTCCGSHWQLLGGRVTAGMGSGGGPVRKARGARRPAAASTVRADPAVRAHDRHSTCSINTACSSNIISMPLIFDYKFELMFTCFTPNQLPACMQLPPEPTTRECPSPRPHPTGSVHQPGFHQGPAHQRHRARSVDHWHCSCHQNPEGRAGGTPPGGARATTALG